MCVGKTDRAVFETCERDSLVKGMIIITSCFFCVWAAVCSLAHLRSCQSLGSALASVTCELSSKCLPCLSVTETPATSAEVNSLQVLGQGSCSLSFLFLFSV